MAARPAARQPRRWAAALLAAILLAAGATGAPRSAGVSSDAHRHLQQDGDVGSPDGTAAVAVPRIAGGENARCGRFPYMVSLRDRADVHLCGGVLIDKKYVLTAAHCVDPDAPRSVGATAVIVIGACGLGDTENENGAVEVLVAADTFIHEGWTGEVQDGNDVALLKLKKRSKLPPVQLPTSNDALRAGQRVMVLGWGLQEDGTNPTNLQRLSNIDVVGNDFCGGEDVWGGLIRDEMLCAADASGGGVCGGDSGGPLLLPFAPNGNVSAGSPDVDVIVGITSFGDEGVCGNSTLPSVFMRVSSYVDWVREKMKGGKSATAPPNGDSSTPAALPPSSSDPPPPEAPAPAPQPAGPPCRTTITLADGKSVNGCPDEVLWEAAFDGDLELVESALKSGADIDARVAGQTPLIAASYQGHVEVALSLLTDGADPSAIGTFDRVPPVFWATAFNHLEILQALVDHDAEANYQDDEGITALFIAAKFENVDAARLLIKGGADAGHVSRNGTTPLMDAARMGKTSIVEVLVEAGADVNIGSNNSTSPLYNAALNGHATTVRHLIQAGAAIDGKNFSAATPLMAAAFGGHTSIVRLLIREGANISRADSFDQTALHYSTVAQGVASQLIATVLLDEGLDVNRQDVLGLTPLLWTAWHGHADTMKLLLERGADPRILARSGKNATELICQCLKLAGQNVFLQCPPIGCSDPETRSAIEELLE